MSESVTLLLLSGQLCDARLWSHQAEALAATRKIHVADLSLDDSIAAMAERAVASLPTRFAVAALSLGGYVAFEILRRWGERVSHLALLNTSARPDEAAHRAERESQLRGARAGIFRGVTRRLLPQILDPVNAENAELGALVMAMAETVGLAGFERQQRAIMDRADYRPLLPAIACPTLVVGGSSDRITPPKLQEEIAAGIPGANLLILDRCGHLAPLEQPGAVTAALAALIHV